MQQVNGSNSISTAQAIEYLEHQIKRITAAPMMQKAAMAESALQYALAILQAFEVRVARLESLAHDPRAVGERFAALEARAAKLEKDFGK